MLTPKQLAVDAFKLGLQGREVDAVVSIFAPNILSSTPFIGVKLEKTEQLFSMLPDADKRFIYGENDTFYFMAYYVFHEHCPFARIYSYALKDIFEIGKLCHHLRQHGYNLPTIAQKQFETVIHIQGHSARVEAYRQNLKRETLVFVPIFEERRKAQTTNIYDWDTEYIIAEICQSPSLLEALLKFKVAAPRLKGCRIVFASPTGPVPGYSVNKTFSAGAVVRGLFKTERVIVCDEKTIEEMMETGRSVLPFGFSISLDTQALSYLEPFFNDRTKGVPSDFLEVFSFISKDDVNVDPIPYMLENLFNLHDQKSANRIFEKLKAYEILRTLDADWLKSRGVVRSVLSASEINKRAQEIIGDMYRDLENVEFMKTLKLRHQYMYAHLLKMSILQIKNRSLNLSKKVHQFIEFCDTEIAALMMREILLARAYFERGQGLSFFRNVQAKKRNIFAQLNSMAWDLWHLHQLEELLTMRPDPNTRYYFPALLTFDKPFIEVIDLYPLKACAYFEGGHSPTPFYEGDFVSLIAGEDTYLKEYVERLYTPEAKASRQSRQDQTKKTLGATIANLENELERVAFVSKQQTK